MTKEIPLKDGGFAIVDAQNYPLLAKYEWYINRGGHVQSKLGVIHRIIMAAPNGIVIDHINLNKLDNREANLRYATIAENNRNRGPRPGKKYKGINKYPDRWTATIGMNGSFLRLGSFKTEREAVEAYNAAAIKYHGEFAYLNPIP